jgi:hypothetical protein
VGVGCNVWLADSAMDCESDSVNRDRVRDSLVETDSEADTVRDLDRDMEGDRERLTVRVMVVVPDSV